MVSRRTRCFVGPESVARVAHPTIAARNAERRRLSDGDEGKYRPDDQSVVHREWHDGNGYTLPRARRVCAGQLAAAGGSVRRTGHARLVLARNRRRRPAARRLDSGLLAPIARLPEMMPIGQLARLLIPSAIANVRLHRRVSDFKLFSA